MLLALFSFVFALKFSLLSCSLRAWQLFQLLVAGYCNEFQKFCRKLRKFQIIVTKIILNFNTIQLLFLQNYLKKICKNYLQLDFFLLKYIFTIIYIAYWWQRKTAADFIVLKFEYYFFLASSYFSICHILYEIFGNKTIYGFIEKYL